MALAGTARSHAARVLCQLIEPMGALPPAPRLVEERLSECSEDERAVLGRALVAYGLRPVPDDADAELLGEVAAVRFGGVPDDRDDVRGAIAGAERGELPAHPLHRQWCGRSSSQAQEHGIRGGSLHRLRAASFVRNDIVQHDRRLRARAARREL